MTYRVSYPGDANHSAVTATRSVAVSRAAASLSLTNNGKIYGYGKTVTFTARLGASYKNRAVAIWADPSGADQKRRGKWQSLIGGYYPTPETFYLNGAGFKGYKLRIRTAYVKGDSGDSLNTTTWTGYQYLSFTK
ncbi:hypothetical protein [Actinoplanes palleronii]|uniref:Uncharacterized protein n=1 Tax=Actinoplanes palleronii TaxID=113570 RepID=A0ABQ4BNU6_9ACTN|nr:hypothetical protein [Actinoplanes palleronii]GIE72348.1 hypothetical protein Apa02nite_084560 [Actinoplanes palleronii]